MSPVIGVKLWGSRYRPCCWAIQRSPAANVKDYVAGFSFQICWVALKLLRRATGIPHPLVALAEPAQPRLAAACGDLAGTVRPDRRRVAGVGRARAALLLHVARLLRRPRAGRGRVGRTNGDRAARDSTAGETNLAGRLRCGFSRRARPRGDDAQLPRLARRRCGVVLHGGTLWGDALVAVAAEPLLAEGMARRFCVLGGLRAAGLVAVAKRLAKLAAAGAWLRRVVRDELLAHHCLGGRHGGSRRPRLAA